MVSAYCASKFAVRGLTQSAGGVSILNGLIYVDLSWSETACEFGKYGITVNAYSPGIIATPMGKLRVS